MQLTRLDRWLREKFVIETHVYTMRTPSRGGLPRRHQALPEAPGRRFRHVFVLRRERDLNRFIDALRRDNLMFKTRVVHRKAWYVAFLAPPDNRSVTWWLVGKVVLLAAFIGLVRLGFHYWDDPEMHKNILDSFRILKG